MPKLKRSDKGARVSRYIGAVTGIPTLRYRMEDSTIECPRPLHMKVTTDRSLGRFSVAVQSMSHEGIGAVIRYDGAIDRIEDAIVGVRLETYAVLLAAYMEKEEANASAHRR